MFNLIKMTNPDKWVEEWYGVHSLAFGDVSRDSDRALRIRENCASEATALTDTVDIETDERQF